MTYNRVPLIRQRTMRSSLSSDFIFATGGFLRSCSSVVERDSYKVRAGGAIPPRSNFKRYSCSTWTYHDAPLHHVDFDNGGDKE